jgi:hypothetical protein
VYSAWAEDPIHSDVEAYSTDKCWRLVTIADQTLSRTAATYPRRILIQALRTIHFRLVAALLAAGDSREVTGILSAATFAAWRFGKPTPQGASVTHGGINALEITLEEWEPIAEHMPLDLVRILGAAFAKKTGEGAYRKAGKGGILEIPIPIPTESLGRIEEGLRFPGLTVFPSPVFEASEALEKSILVYERRRDRQSGLAVSGFLSPAGSEDASFNGWVLKSPTDPLCPLRVEVAYPVLNKTVITESYLPFAVKLSSLDRLRSFSSEFELQFGFDVEVFEIVGRELFSLVGLQTGFSALEKLREADDVLILRSRIKDPELADGCASHLFSLCQRGYLRATREGFLQPLVMALEAKGRSDARALAEKFIDSFLVKDRDSLSLEPALFYEVDSSLLVFDGFLWGEFLERCLRQVTRETGSVGKQRGRLFEVEARELLISRCQLGSDQIPFRPNWRLKEDGIDQGEVDFAFLWEDTLVHMDIKSRQWTDAYLRGDWREIKKRQSVLTEQLTKQAVPLGKRLLEIINGKRQRPLRTVLNFLCVANVEYVSLDCPALWYGEIPRVLTPEELVALVLDENAFRSIVQIAEAEPA